MADEHNTVSRNEVPGAQFYDVTGHDLAHWAFRRLAAAPHGCSDGDRRLECGNGRCRSSFLHDVERDRCHDDQNDDDKTLPIPGCTRNHRGNEQNCYKRLGKLFSDARNETLMEPLQREIFSKSPEALGGFIGC